MKIDVNLLKVGKSILRKEEVVLDESYKCLYPLLGIKNIFAEAEVTAYQEFIEVSLLVNAVVSLECSYTLKAFDYKIKDRINLEFTQYEEDATEDTILIDNNTIELDSYIFDLISMNVPSKPVMKGASKPSDGKGYRVLSEEEYVKEQENKTNDQFDKLLELEFDDEEEK
ncbi:MAG: YceD family protein [Bacilli bacterium]|nr:YceD family protein [Bacilli bacterium]